jgi:hypothetical protein
MACHDLFWLQVAACCFMWLHVASCCEWPLDTSYDQIIASANTAYNIPFPPAVNSFLSSLRVFLVDVISITRTSCTQPMTYYDSMVRIRLST